MVSWAVFTASAMCGPLALALPGSNRSMGYLVGSRLVYNAGRLVTLFLLGLAVGLVSNMISLGNLGSLFLIGLLNALLPCGFIHLALTTALATGTVLKSFVL